jgi:hypothetical protein
VFAGTADEGFRRLASNSGDTIMNRSAKRHEQHPRGNDDEPMWSALQVAREKQQPRHEEMKRHQEDGKILPAIGGARDHVGDLFNQIRRKREEVLREIEVRPQHHEREHQLAQVMEVMRLEET